MIENQNVQPLAIEAEELPALRYRLYAVGTEGLDMGYYGANTWIKENGGDPVEKAFVRYDFTASSGYSQRKDNYSSEGQAIRFLYDLAGSPYAKKRQFRVSSHIYVLGKTFTKTNVDAAYTTALTQAERKALKTSVDYNNLTARDVPYNNIVLNQYNKIGTPGSGIYVLPGLTGRVTANVYYAAYTELQMAGVTSANPPYLEMAAEDVVPYPVNPSPSEQFVDRTEDIPISWEMGYDQSRSLWQEAPNGSLFAVSGVVDGQLYQKAALLRWKQEGDPTVHEVRMGSENRYLLPAGSVTADSFQWQVLLTTDDDVDGEDTGLWYTATTNNDAVSASTIVAPRAVIIDGGRANLFQWTHEIATGTRPTGADLQYSPDNGDTWVDFLHVDTREPQTEVPPGSLPGGVLLWRVRTYNASGTAGGWSESAQITVLSAPPAPKNITVTSLPRPTIQWAAEGQVAAEVSVDGGKSVRLYGDASSMEWGEILADGPHQVKVRAQNQETLWGSWGTADFTTVNYPQAELALTGQAVENGVLLKWAQGFGEVHLLRNGVLIRRITDGSTAFTDWETAVPHEYQVRGVTDEGYYTLSAPVTAGPQVKQAAVGNGDGQWVPLTGRYNAPPEHHRQLSQQVKYQYYAGRKKPVALASGWWDVTHFFAFSLKKSQRELLHQLEGLSGGPVIYKDSRGDCALGTLEQVSSKDNGLYLDLTFQIRETDRTNERSRL